MYQRLFRNSLVGGAVIAAGLSACAPRPEPQPSYVLFFTAFSSQLEPEALGVVQDAANAARAQGNTPVIVEGYANAATAPGSAVNLSVARAQRVADQLVADGVARGRVSLPPQPRQGAPAVVSRRVAIVVTPR